jgi:hypothetical protein
LRLDFMPGTLVGALLSSVVRRHSKAMRKPSIEQWVRLGLGAILNVVLWQISHIGRGTGNIEREFRDTILSASIGAVILVCVVPLFWRGEPWQAPLAFLLMWLPSFALFMAVAFAATHLW